MAKLTQGQKITIAVLLLLFATAKVLGLMWWRSHQPEVASVTTACDLRQGCTLPNGVQLQFRGLSTQAPFEMRAQQVPNQAQAVTVSFSMRDMDMGFNRYELVKQADGSWFRANNRLPVCVQGRHDWLADIAVDDAVFQVAFVAE